MKKGKDLKIGDLVPIYYNSTSGSSGWLIDKMGLLFSIDGYKSKVLMDDGTLEGWSISDLKKMAAHKKREERVNEGW